MVQNQGILPYLVYMSVDFLVQASFLNTTTALPYLLNLKILVHHRFWSTFAFLLFFSSAGERGRDEPREASSDLDVLRTQHRSWASVPHPHRHQLRQLFYQGLCFLLVLTAFTHHRDCRSAFASVFLVVFTVAGRTAAVKRESVPSTAGDVFLFPLGGLQHFNKRSFLVRQMRRKRHVSNLTSSHTAERSMP